MNENDSKQGCLAIKPSNISYDEATAAAYGGLLAYQFLGKGNIQQGKSVLIYGAYGTAGIIAIQFAKDLGAKVTGVCSTTNLEFVKSLGADVVIDYTKVNSLASGATYDFILGAVGKRKTSKLKDAGRKALFPGGKYVSIDDGNLLLDSSRLDFIKEHIEAGHIKLIIDKSYSFEDIVEAHRYVERGHKKGGVVIKVK